MKNLSYTLILIAVILITIISSCKKEKVNAIDTSTGLIGKWKLDANFISTGAPGVWITIPKTDDHTVRFNADGTLGGNEFPDYHSYTVKDSLLVLKNTSDGLLSFFHTIRHDTLTISPAGPLCIEGCAIRFVKVK